MKTRALVPLVLLLGLQALDIVVHVATGQIELMRVTSNVIISLGAIVSVLALTYARPVIILAGFLYLALNFVFLVDNGIVNTATGALRLPLFGFVAVSLLLMAWLVRGLTTGQSDS